MNIEPIKQGDYQLPAIQKELSAIEIQVKALETSLTSQGLPPDKVNLSFEILDHLMSARKKLNKKSLSELQIADIGHRIDACVFRTLSLFPTALPQEKGLTTEMKSFIFAKLYRFSNKFARDSTGKEGITDIVGQEMENPLSMRLANELLPDFKDHMKEALNFASYVYPFVLLSLYQHKDAPLPSKEQISSLAKADGKQFISEYRYHFADVHPGNDREWENNLETWKQMFPLGVEMIWRGRMEAGS